MAGELRPVSRPRVAQPDMSKKTADAERHAPQSSSTNSWTHGAAPPLWQSAQFTAVRSPISTGCLNGWLGIAAKCSLPSSCAARVWQELQSLLMTLPDRADVIAVVAAEAAGGVEMANIVGVSQPVDLHLREERGAEDALQLGDSSLSRLPALDAGNLRIFRLVEGVDLLRDRLLRFGGSLVVGR